VRHGDRVSSHHDLILFQHREKDVSSSRFQSSLQKNFAFVGSREERSEKPRIRKKEKKVPGSSKEEMDPRRFCDFQHILKAALDGCFDGLIALGYATPLRGCGGS
jgi:hypothetical protein